MLYHAILKAETDTIHCGEKEYQAMNSVAVAHKTTESSTSTNCNAVVSNIMGSDAVANHSKWCEEMACDDADSGDDDNDENVMMIAILMKW